MAQPKPSTPASRLGKVLQLERRSSYQDTAVIGGLEGFIEALAKELMDTEPVAAVAGRLQKLVRGYAIKPPEARRAVVRELEDCLRALEALDLSPQEGGELPPSRVGKGARGLGQSQEVRVMDWVAIELSVRLALTTTLSLLALGLPVAYWLAFSERRWKFFVEAIVALPLVLPPTVLGFYILIAIGPQSPLGQFYETLTGRLLPFSFQGLLIASVLYSLPFAVQPLVAAFSSVDRRLIEASWSLGISEFATFFRVIVPLSLPGIVTAIVLSFAHTLGEFGVVLMIGGNIAGVTRTVSISIYDSVQALDYAAAGQTALLLLGVSFTVLVVTYALQRKMWAVWPLN